VLGDMTTRRLPSGLEAKFCPPGMLRKGG